MANGTLVNAGAESASADAIAAHATTVSTAAGAIISPRTTDDAATGHVLSSSRCSRSSRRSLRTTCGPSTIDNAAAASATRPQIVATPVARVAAASPEVAPTIVTAIIGNT